MAARKLVRDFLLPKQPQFYHLLTSHQVAPVRLRLLSGNGYSCNRQFSVFNEFSKKVKGEVEGNQDFQKTVKELKEKAGELKEAKEELKAKTKQTTEQLYKKVDGVWTDAEATAKKVSANVKEKVSAAAEEVKGSFGIGKQDLRGSSANTSGKSKEDAKHASKAESEGKATPEEGKSSDSEQTLFDKIKSTISSASPKISSVLQNVKDTKVIDFAKRGVDIVKDELSGNSGKRSRIQHAAAPASSPAVEKSTRTDIVLVPSKQSRWSKKWEAVKEKMQRHPLFKRVSGLSEPVVTKSQEIAEDVRERWETSDSPVVHKIQDINESVFGESHAALSFKEIRRRDPSFSLPEFVAEVQEVVKPVLNAYMKGDTETLKKYCSPEVIERCNAERKAYASQGIFFDNKILHISDVELRETKLMGSTPIIILAFQTQQVHCVRDKHGSVKEGGKDTIHTVYYAWAMQPKEGEDSGSAFPVWVLREMQRLGIQALI